MEIENGYCIPSSEEKSVLGAYKPKVPIGEIDLFSVKERLDGDEQQISARRSAGDDLTHDEKISIHMAQSRLNRHRIIFGEMVGQLMPYISDDLKQRLES
jgi:hypothetical protein